ncbi:amidase [Roseateles sp.]|uniref:amidase n=1 Tax=Roseateles sp. TaxID=1971397 RepID=UPI0039E7CA63
MTHPYSWERWSALGAVDIADHVRRGEVSAAEVAAQAHAAALRVEPQISALVELLDEPHHAPDVALPPAREGLLAGVPFFLKDLGSSIAGLKRENGSALHRDEVVTRTDPLPAAWLKQGVQVLGRATTAELGMGYDTSTVYRGLQVTRNPWNTARTAGGSSGGSAALVAAGVVPLTHATDGAGSIRQPAALNGLVGLKVSRGLLPLPWHVNELLNTSMVEGVFARTLEDTALALDAATSEPAPLGKLYSAGQHSGPTQALAALGRDLPRPLHVGFTTDAFGRPGGCEPQRAAVVRNVAAALDRDGHHVEDICPADLPDWSVLWRSFKTFWAGMRAASWRLTHGDLSPEQVASLSPGVQGYWRASSDYGQSDLMRYLGDNVKTALAFGKLLERFDVLLLPVVPFSTPLANTTLSPAVAHEFEGFLENFLDAGRYTMPANEAGLPALALAAGLDTEGLPMGIQLYGRWGEETALLQAGAAVQRVIQPLAPRPAVHVMNRC